ncbi:MAG: GNAT family N-acetyltransferase [Syntrophales bacterium]
MQIKTVCENSIRYTAVQVPTEEQAHQIAEMYQAQGWWQPHDDGKECLIASIIRGSHCFVIATDGDKIVGMGRAISDGISDAYIQDLTVKKDRRNQGIGKRILRTLLKRLRADGISWIGLIAEPGSCDLYSHAGFRKMKESVPMLMTEEP